MWVWITALVVLIGCFIVVWRLLVNSFDGYPGDRKRGLFSSLGSHIPERFEISRNLEAKLESLETRSAYFGEQIDKLNKKINSMLAEVKPAFLNKENIPKNENGFSNVNGSYDVSMGEEEDWKELFYEENEKKEKLENDLDTANQEIQKLRSQLAKRDKEIESTQKLMESSALKQSASQPAPLSVSLPFTPGIPIDATNSETTAAPRDPPGESTDDDTITRKLRAKMDQQRTGPQGENQNVFQQLNELTIQNSILLEKIKQTGTSQSGTASPEPEILKRLDESERKREELTAQIDNLMKYKLENENFRDSLNTLRNENEGYRRQIAEIFAHQSEIEGRIIRLKDLETKVSRLKGENQVLMNLLGKALHHKIPDERPEEEE